MGITLYAHPAFGFIDPQKWLGGDIVKNNKAVLVPTDNFNPFTSLTNKSANTDMLTLDRYLHMFPGTREDPTKILLHSRSSQIGSKWLREIGPNSDINPETVEWWMTGNPEQKFTGAGYVYPDIDKPLYPGKTQCVKNCPTPPALHGGYGYGFGLPLKTKYIVHMIATEYDGWACVPPPKSLNIPEIKKMFSPGGFLLPSRVIGGPHTKYEIPLFNKDRSLATGIHQYIDPDEPTVTYWYLPTYPVPGSSLFGRKEDDLRRRKIINAQYTNMPVMMGIPEDS